jgi:hypothetical protein
MKVFVRDYGWAGTDFYCCETREEAMIYFINDSIISYLIKSLNHNEKTNGPNPYKKQWQQEKWDIFHCTEEYEVSNRLLIRTEGE